MSNLRGSHGISQIAVGRLARVRSTTGTGGVHRRRGDDAVRVLLAIVDGTVRIGVRRGGSHGGRGRDIRSARCIAASAILTVIVIAASVLTVVATVGVLIIVAGVLAVAVPAAAAVTGRVLVEPFVDFSRLARIAVPSENRADAKYESETADDSDDGEGHADAGFVCEKAFRGGARCWIGQYGGRGTGDAWEGVGPGGGTAEGRYTTRLEGI